MKSYYDHVMSLSPELLKIHTYCWDETGRANFESSYEISIGMLCEISDDFNTFKANCEKFFSNFSTVEKDLFLSWHCYMTGIKFIVKKLKENSSEV